MIQFVALGMWTINYFILTCNVNGYGKINNCSTPKYVFVMPWFEEVIIGLNLTWEIMCICNKQHWLHWMWLEKFCVCERSYLWKCYCWRVKMVKHGGFTCVWKIIVVGINMVTHDNYQECYLATQLYHN